MEGEISWSEGQLTQYGKGSYNGSEVARKTTAWQRSYRERGEQPPAVAPTNAHLVKKRVEEMTGKPVPDGEARDQIAEYLASKQEVKEKERTTSTKSGWQLLNEQHPPAKIQPKPLNTTPPTVENLTEKIAQFKEEKTQLDKSGKSNEGDIHQFLISKLESKLRELRELRKST